MACFLGPDLLQGAGPAHSWRSQHRRGGGRVCVHHDARGCLRRIRALLQKEAAGWS